MIEWRKYDPYSRDIESHVDHLITDGANVWVAQHAKYISREGYGWHDGGHKMSVSITHYAEINLPDRGE